VGGELAVAAGARLLAVEGTQVGGRAAERAAILHLPENDAVAVEGDLEVVAVGDVERLAHLGWKDDPAEVVDLARHPGARLPGTRPSRIHHCSKLTHHYSTTSVALLPHDPHLPRQPTPY